MVQGKRPPVAAVTTVSKFGAFAAVAHADGVVLTYDVEAEKFDRSYVGPRVPVAVLTLNPKRARIAAYADRDGSVFCDVSADSKPIACLPHGSRPVALDASETMIAAAGGAAKELILLQLDENDSSVKPSSENCRKFGLGHLHRNAITAIALVPHEPAVVVCCQAITVISTSSGRLLRRFSGHQTPVSAVALVPELNCFVDSGADSQKPCKKFVTACVGDQFLSLWNIPCPCGEDGNSNGSDTAALPKKRRKDSSVNACHSFVAPEKGAREVIFDRCDENACKLSFAALLPSGSVAVWCDWDPMSVEKTTKHSFIVRPASSDCVLFASFRKNGVLAVARGHPLRPQYFSVDIGRVTAHEVVMPPCNVDGLLAGKAVTGRTSTSGVAVATSEAKVTTATKESAFRGSQFSLMNGVGRSAGTSSSVQIAPVDVATKQLSYEKASHRQEDEDAEDGCSPGEEITLGEKLAAMGMTPSSTDETMKNSPYSAERENAVSELDYRNIESLSNVLIQAIQTKDYNLFDNVVENSKKQRQIIQTVARMPAVIATRDFLDMLSVRVVERPSRAPALVPWIRQILLEHAGALLTQERSAALERLIHSINSRVENLPALTRLEGKLELVIAQADRVRAAKARATGHAKPAVEYMERAVAQNHDRTSGGEAAPATSSSESDDDEEETGDFSEDDSDSSSWENNDLQDGENVEGVASRSHLPNGKAKDRDLMEISDSDSEHV